jgi:hypothetical protein
MSHIDSRLRSLESLPTNPMSRGTLVVPSLPGESEEDTLRRWKINPSEWSEVEFGQRPPG